MCLLKPNVNRAPYRYDRHGHWWFVYKMTYTDTGSSGDKDSAEMTHDEAKLETYKRNGWLMRYTLRNQKKIELAYPGTIERILSSLDTYFSKHLDLRDSEFIGNEEFRTLIIPDIGHSVNMIAFYIISKKFDIYNLAFKSFL